MTVMDFLAPDHLDYPEKGSVAWKAPSNIALVKYWGKKPNQIPANPSLSFTLDRCSTSTTITYEKREGTMDSFSFEFLFDGRQKAGFEPKIITFLERIAPYFPFLRKYHFKIESSNSFPHSSGIASSASGMAALALGLCSVEAAANPKMRGAFFNKKASFAARLGSGSASRSVEGPLVQWGETPSIAESSDLYGLPYPFTVHPLFDEFQDTILLVHRGQKYVSSTVGHALMKGHPFAGNRFGQAHSNLERLRAILKTGDLEGFIALVESEALTLHAMMMTSNPYFVLMHPNTLAIIHAIWEFRKETQLPISFTLDAGANVHVLYPKQHQEEGFRFIEDRLLQFCEKGQYICDQAGKGASMLEEIT